MNSILRRRQVATGPADPTCMHTGGVAASPGSQDPAATPLSQVEIGSRVVVTRILGDEHLRGRLIALGLAPGASVSVASGGHGRPRVLTLRGSRVAIDDRCSGLVLVRPHLDASEGPAA